MLTDSISNAHLYDHLHPKFHTVFEILQSLNLSALSNGHIDLDEQYAYIDIQTTSPRSRKDARLETHQKYIDIQMPLSSQETFGYKQIDQCHSPATDYNDDTDVQFWSAPPDRFITIEPGQFIIFFPEDAHAPCIDTVPDHQKLVAKISIATRPVSAFF